MIRFPGGRQGRRGGGRRWAHLRRAANIAAALVVSVVLLGVLGFGYDTIPALGPALDPGRGAWTSAARGEPVHAQTLSLAGLRHAVTVSFTAHGVASVRAASDHDMFLALGYLHAQFRLSEMDEERRLAEGRLAQLGGPTDLSSDEFELRLGLLRTAQKEWAQMPAGQPGRLGADRRYAQGVNARLAQVRASGQWPAAFSLAGVYPGPWTPVDSLVIQGELTQELDFTSTPLDYALLERSLGAARTMDWFPVIAKNAQTPYDPGPYAKLPLTPLIPGSPPARHAPGRRRATRLVRTQPRPKRPRRPPCSPSSASSRIRVGHLHEYPDSNAWAANGPAVAGGGALLAGDPHLPQTIPSVWYEVALSAPGFDAAGVSVPGLPGILIGHNARIAWSLTDTQNQATLFYAEKTRPGQYYWRGAWRPMQVVHYTIGVRGAATRQLTVDITVHGPIMTQAGQTTLVDWKGNVPSPDLAAMLAVDQAANFRQFKRALAGGTRRPRTSSTAGWPTRERRAERTAYVRGRAASIPAVARAGHGQPAAGHRRLPVLHRHHGRLLRPRLPRGHHLRGAARPARAAYPGKFRRGPDQPDGPARRAHGPGTADRPARYRSFFRRTVRGIRPGHLARHDGGRLPAASVWWTFWGDYLSAVFQPWWNQAKVPVGKDREGLAVSVDRVSLDEDLEAWTLGDPANPAFALPSGHRRTAPQVMRQAFATTVAHLSFVLGGAPPQACHRAILTRRYE